MPKVIQWKREKFSSLNTIYVKISFLSVCCPLDELGIFFAQDAGRDFPTTVDSCFKKISSVSRLVGGRGAPRKKMVN
ncbi:MAG TPA: hypothetical protein VFG46_18745 [Chryseolinea sp.]|nr:hypothetical protein [Chryseolinea sp.]